MKIDVSSAKPCTSELPAICASTINEMKSAGSDEEFIAKLSHKDWQSVISKTELIRWAEVLDRCDTILEKATTVENSRLLVDHDETCRHQVESILKFTGILFENTSTRSVYSSTDRLLSLLDSSSMEIVIETLKLFQTIAKRSHFLRSKLPAATQAVVLAKLTAIAQTWFGRLRTIKMKDVVCTDLKLPTLFPFVYKNASDCAVNIEEPKASEPLLSVVERHTESLSEEAKSDPAILARLRTIRGFGEVDHRIRVLSARLVALSTLIYSRILTDDSLLSALIFPGFIEECAELLKLDSSLHPDVDCLKAESLRTLTSIAGHEKHPRLQQVIDALGANSYHGFLAVLTRQCVDDLRANQLGQPGKASISLCTALFSMLYHVSGIDSGGDAIVSCGLMQTLLSVVSCHTLNRDQLSFVTRSVRVIDIVTTIDVQGFNQAKGLEICVDRLVYEVNQCRKEQPFVIDVTQDKEDDSGVNEYLSSAPPPINASSGTTTVNPQRAALIKSLLNFVKRVVQDNQFSDSVRHIMEGELPSSLIHLISNADYYTASLYHNSIQLITNFIYQEPTQLTQLQQQHVPFVILQSLLRKEIPSNRDVINNIANTFTALCLNERGLAQLKAYQPFDHVFKIILSLKFITAMKRKRSDINDIAIGMGSALDDLLRHQPTLRPLMTASIVKVMNTLVEYGNSKDRKIVMSLKSSSKAQLAAAANSPSREPSIHSAVQSPRGEDDSDEEDDMSSENNQAEMPEVVEKRDSSPALGLENEVIGPDGNRVMPLGDYLLVFLKIVETMITQNNSSDVVDGIVDGGGVPLLLGFCQMPTIKVELANSTVPSTIANIIKFILQNSRNDQLLPTVMSTISNAFAPLANMRYSVDGNVGAMSALGATQMAETLTTVTNTTTVLSCLGRTAQSSQEDLRNRVLKAWNEESGVKLLQYLNMVFRVISCELAVVKLIQNSKKSSATTQTEKMFSRPGTPATDGSATPVVELAGTATTTQTTSTDLPLDVTEGASNKGVELEQPVDAVQAESAPPRKSVLEVAGVSPAEEEFWHQHKELQSLLVKAQKNLSDFLMQLGRACLKPNPRSRRQYEAVPGPMSKVAKTLAESLFRQWRDALQSAQGQTSLIMNSYLNELLEQLSTTIFDDRRQPFISLLAMFYRSGCHRTFCQMLVDTIAPQFKNTGYDSASVRSLELLLTQWMRFADKLINKNNLVNSRNKVSDMAEFPPAKYHKLVLTDLFTVFNQLFTVLSSEGVDLKLMMSSCEMAITVYKEIVRNLVSLRNESTTSSASPTRNEAHPNAADLVDAAHLQMLMDMGFGRNEVIEALMQCSTVSEATEYLISNVTADVEMAAEERANRPPRAVLAGREPAGRERDPPPPPVEIPGLVAVDRFGTGRVGGAEDVQGPSGVLMEEARHAVEDMVAQVVEGEKVTPLSQLIIDFNLDQAVSRTCNEMVPLCKRLMDVGSDLVFSTADLVIGVIDSCDPEWKKEELVKTGMGVEVVELAQSLLGSPNCENTARSLSTRLHFSCLLWEHVAEDYVSLFDKQVPVRQTLINLFWHIVHKSGNDYHFQDKGVLSPLLLWLDLYEKCTRMLRRKEVLLKVLKEGVLKWSFYQWEERFGARGKWQAYDAEANKQINKAFLEGKPRVAFKYQKRDYSINFSDMTQKSETGNGVDKNIVCVELPEGTDVDMSLVIGEEKKDIWTPDELQGLMQSLIAVLNHGTIHHSVAHSTMLLLVRLTKSPEVAAEFIKMNGLTALLQVRCMTSPSTAALLTLIVRQCMDDQPMLAQMFERSIRAVAGGSHNSQERTSFHSRWNPARNSQMRDWKSSLYVLTPLISRDASLYVKTMGKAAKLSDGKLASQMAAHGHCPGHATVHPSGNTHMIVEQLLREVIDGDWPRADDATAQFNPRMVSKGAILTVVAELLRGYGCVANVVTELKHEGQSIVYRLIDTYIEKIADQDTHTALKTLIGTLASCNHATRAQDSLVMDVKSVIAAISQGSHAGQAPEKVITKVSELASLVLLMRDACPNTHIPAKNPTNPAEAPPAPTQNTNYIIRLLHKRKVCNDLVRAITQLPLGKKEAVETVNNVLKTLDEITKNINQFVPIPPTTTAAVAGIAATAASTSAAPASSSSQPDSAAPPTPSGSAPAAVDRTISDPSVTMPDVSFTGLPDHTVPPPHVPYNEEDDQEESDDDDDEDMDDDDDDDGVDDDDDVDDGREEDSDESEQENSADEPDEPQENDVVLMDGHVHDDTIMGNEEDEGDEMVEDSMSSGEEDNAIADDTMGDDDDEEGEEDENEGGRILDVQIANDAVEEEDSEMDDDDDDDDFGRFVEEVDDYGLNRLGAADLLDAGVLLDGRIDDFAFFAQGAGGGHIQFPPNNAARRPQQPHEHPLLVRPSGIGDNLGAERRHPNDTLRMNQRHMLMDRLAQRQFQGQLQRQGAVRHAHARILDHNQLFNQIFDLGTVGVVGAARGLFEGRPRPLLNVLQEHYSGEATERRFVAVCNALERLTDGVRMLDQHSLQFVALLINAIVTKKATEAENQEKEKEEKEKASKAAETTSVGTAVSATSTSMATAASGSQESMDGIGRAEAPVLLDFSELVDRNQFDVLRLDQGDEQLDVVHDGVEPMDTTDNTPAVAVVNPVNEETPMEQANGAGSASQEARDMLARSVNMEPPPTPPREGEENAADIRIQEVPAVEDIPVELMDMPQTPPTEQAPPPPSREEFQAAMDAIIAGPTPTGPNVVTSSSLTDMLMGLARDAQTAVDAAVVAAGEAGAAAATTAPGAEQPAAAAAAEGNGMVRVPEEYRDVLGDIEIPEGVDAAFLAALPDDMRQEVLRDHERQRRVQRAAAPIVPATVAPTANAPSTSGAAATASGAADGAAPAAPNIPGVEPLDQEFLAALPPELQEEIRAQHDRAVREALAAVEAAANPPPPVAPENDAVLVIESLAPSLRAQVLADADDSVIAALPPHLAAEARRLRQQMDREALRYHHRLMIPTRRGFHAGRHGQGPSGQAALVGGQAGATTAASSTAVQVLDRDSIVTLVMLYLIDNPRLSVGRLQKVLRAVCSHAASCDFVIWCLLALLDKAAEGVYDDDTVSGPSSWVDSITVSGSGNNERALKISKTSIHGASTVAVHPLVGVKVGTGILDTLTIISKHFPGHFLPASLRANTNQQNSPIDMPALSKFWQLVQHHGQGKQYREVPLAELRFAILESSPVGTLMNNLEKQLVKKNTTLQDRLLSVATAVIKTLPNDTVTRLGLPEDSCPLGEQLHMLINTMTGTGCSKEGLQEGRTLLVEAMRALSKTTATVIYNTLFDNIETLGLQLKPQIEEMNRQMEEKQPSSSLPAPPEVPEVKKGKIQTNRWDGERVVLEGDASGRPLANASACEELQLPAVRALTDKGGVQHSLLSSLQTLCKVRDTMRQIRDHKKKEDERKRKEEEEEKAKKKREEDEAKSVAAALAAGTTTEGGVSGVTVTPVAPSVTFPGETSVEPSSSTSGGESSSKEEGEKKEEEEDEIDERLSERLAALDDLWPLVSICLGRLGKASDSHAVLALQPAAESFFLVHAVPSAANDHEHPDTKKLITFAEQHRSVLNQVLRQNPTALSDGGPFTVLTQFPKLLDFDVKRKYFRKQLSSMDDNRSYRREDVPVRVRRSQIFSESYRELFRLRPHEWKHRFYIMFDGEEGQDAGGLLREWYSVITREIFNPNYALFITSPGDRVTYMINNSSYINPEHLDYFKFVGRIIAKAVYDNKLLDCYFTRAFYKHILNLPVRYQDLESEDPSFYNSLQFILENPINELGLDLTFSLEVEEFGVREFRDLKPDGQNIAVTDENKEEYVKLVCQMKMTGSIRKQLDAFLSGFYEVIPKHLIAMFNEQELELLISGLPEVDIDDLAANTEYRSFSKTSPQIQWFWRALRAFEQEDRAKFLQFVTGTSKVPLQGFASLEGMNGVQKFSIHMDSRTGDRLPTAHTCFNQLDLPQYETYEKLRDCLLIAIRECTEGFGFA